MMDKLKSDPVRHPTITLSKTDFQRGYFTSGVYDGYNAVEKNISFTILEDMMGEACPIDSCMCISSFQLGIPINVILLNDKTANTSDFFIQPIVEQKSEENFKVRHLTATSTHIFKTKEDFIQRPVWIIIDYENKDGTRSRVSLKKTKSACIMQCIEIEKKKFEK